MIRYSRLNMLEQSKWMISIQMKYTFARVMSLESGGWMGNLNIVQLYEDSVDLGQELRLWIARQNGQNGAKSGSQQQRQPMTGQNGVMTSQGKGTAGANNNKMAWNRYVKDLI